MLSGIFVLVCFTFINLNLVSSISVCDEKDLVLFIDSAVVANRAQDVVNVINDIIDNGSNERDGFSVIVYGDLDGTVFERDDDIIIVDKKDTKHVHKKAKQQDYVDEQLANYFGVISSSLASPSSSDIKRIELAEAMKIAADNKQTATAYNKEDVVFLVFEEQLDVEARLARCNFLDTYQDEYDDVHFILNSADQEDEGEDEGAENCDGDHFDFFQLDDIMQDSAFLLGVTCPTEISITDGEHGQGRIKLSTKANYIELDTIMSCELWFDDEGGLEAGSFILVDNAVNDDANYKKGAIIIADKDKLALMSEECRFPLFKIRKIEKTEQPDMLKVYVSTPVLFEYITEAHIHGDHVAMNQFKNKRISAKNTNKKRRLLASGSSNINEDNEFSSNGITIGIEASASVSASFVFEYCLIFCWGGSHVDELSLTLRGYASLTPFIRIRYTGAWYSWKKSKKFSRLMTFWIAFIPVVVRPYVELAATIKGVLKFDLNLEFPLSTSYSLKVGLDGVRRSFSGPSTPDIDLARTVCGATTVALTGSITVGVGLTMYEVLSGYIHAILESTNSVKLCDRCVDTRNAVKIEAGGAIRDDLTGFKLFNHRFGPYTVMSERVFYSKRLCISQMPPNLDLLPFDKSDTFDRARNVNHYYPAPGAGTVAGNAMNAIWVFAVVLVLVNLVMAVYLYYGCGGGDGRKGEVYQMVHNYATSDTDDEAHIANKQ